ncbi:hypothetical protein Bbelb_038830 [Branchiostoma belcheri]|nr:hypothetical protein Bbelb_038830 [Branchiostoma belcheri]
MNDLDSGIPPSITPVKYVDDLTNSEFLMASLPGQMQVSLDSVDSWANSYGMKANAKKTKDMYTLSKVQPRIHYLRVARRAGLPSDVLLQIYKSFIRPVLEYGSPVWGGLPRGLSDDLDRVQKICLRICGLPPEQQPTLESRRREASIRELKRILKDPSHPCHTSIHPTEEPRYELRRRSQYKLPISRTERHKNSFVPRAIKDRQNLG